MKKQSDQGLPCLLFWRAFCEFQPWWPSPTTVNVLKFQTLVTCQKGLDKQCRPTSTASEEAVWSGSALFLLNMKKQSDQGSLFAFLTSILRIPTLVTKPNYRKFSKISNPSYLPKRSRQTVQTQIRLLLKKQKQCRPRSDCFWRNSLVWVCTVSAYEGAVWSGSSLLAILTSILQIPTMMTKQTTVNVLKFQMLVTCQKGLDKQCRPRSDCFWRSSLFRSSLIWVCTVSASEEAVWSGSALFAFLTSILRIPTLMTKPNYRKCSKISNPTYLPKRSRQTVQT